MTGIVTTPLSIEELLEAASNYLYPDNDNIPPEIITEFIARAAEEYLANFCSEPKISPALQEQIHQRITEYRQEDISEAFAC